LSTHRIISAKAGFNRKGAKTQRKK